MTPFLFASYFYILFACERNTTPMLDSPDTEVAVKYPREGRNRRKGRVMITERAAASR
jgi:hypothetical protein